MTTAAAHRGARWPRRPSVRVTEALVAVLATVAFAVLAFGSGAPAGAGASPAVGSGSPGSQGVVNGLPPTASQVTVNGTGPMPGWP